MSATQGWFESPIEQRIGFVAAVASLHTDGRLRERATRVLARHDGRVVTSALAVRLLDHVPQVRAAARRALFPRLDTATAGRVLELLLAGHTRRHAPGAITFVQEALLDTMTPAVLTSSLQLSANRDVRRWALTLGHDRDALTTEQLVAAARSDPDRWVRATCSGWLAAIAAPQQLHEMLTSPTVEARLAALTQISDDDLDDGALAPLLAEKAPRVREHARWRARRRGLDTAAWYRRQLNLVSNSRAVVGACIDRLARPGVPDDLPVISAYLSDRSPRVRAAAVTGVGMLADRGEALTLLEPLLLDNRPRVASTAARILGHLHVPAVTAERAWNSFQVWSRCAA